MFQNFLKTEGFRLFLRQIRVPDAQAIWLVRWVEKVLTETPMETSADSKIDVFLDSSKSGMADWQRRQASLAWSHYMAFARLELGPVGTDSPIESARKQIRRLHYSYRTEQTYLDWIRRFLDYSGKSGGAPSAECLEGFLMKLNEGRGVSASTLNQALHAIPFLFRHVCQVELPAIDKTPHAKVPRRLPKVIPRSEVARLWAAMPGATRLKVSIL